MTVSTRSRRRLPAVGYLVAAVATSLVVTACGGSSSTGSGAAPSAGAGSGSSSAPAATADPAAVQAAIDKAFLTHIDAASLNPLIVEGIGVATRPVTPEMETAAMDCWKNNSCTIPGGGKVTLGIADGFGGNAWRKFTKMEIILQALQYPEVGKIIYLDANADLAKMQANVRSLAAQGAKVIVGYNDFGPAMVPTYAQATRQGAKVATYASPVPGATGDQVTTQVIPNLCDVGKAQADATAQILGAGGGDVAFFNGTPGNPQGQAWNKCASDQFAAKYPSIKVAASEDTSWTPDGTYKAASALIATGKPVKAILYDYADPMPQIFKAYDQAGKPSPAMVTWTVNNDLNKLWTEQQGSAKAFPLIYTNGTNWTSRVAVTACLDALAGKDVPAVVNYPLPFVTADDKSWVKDRPGDFVQSLLIPDSVLDKMSAS